jgi:hypothetical protein
LAFLKLHRLQYLLTMRHELLGLRAPLAVVKVPNTWIFICILCMRLALLVISISTRSIVDLMQRIFLPGLHVSGYLC